MAGTKKALRSQQIPFRLKRARERAGLTQSALSVKAGLARGTVFAIESGARLGNVGVATVERLALALAIRPEWLAVGVGPGPSEED